MDMLKLISQMHSLQGKMEKLQEELAAKTVEFSAGAGAVKAVVNGKHELISLEISESVVDKEEIDMLRDLIMAAVNGALYKASLLAQEEMSGLAEGLSLPDIFKNADK